MLTSLNIATDGLLDRGSKLTLSIATRGLIVILVAIGKSKGRKYQILYEATELEMALKDDNDFMEIITMIIEAELL